MVGNDPKWPGKAENGQEWPMQVALDLSRADPSEARVSASL